jgi:hypothetical protein
MHIELGTVLILSALISALVLALNRGDRIFPIVALIATGLQAAIHFGILSLSVAKFRIDVILPALLVIAGGVCWARASRKPTVTAATVLFAIGALELGVALRLFG